ncbi:hypothetical protein KAR91_16105 [Candidatus Pacearchaeota archaeon]|nr:hypothetical protein [Candidatus Pacearchaeota archaeon]
MASTKYTYSILNDFPNQKVNPSTLTTEITSSSISTSLEYINTSVDDDTCDIWFESELSGMDQTSCTSIVLVHDGEPDNIIISEVPDIIIVFGMNENSDAYWECKKTTWVNANSFIFRGSNVLGIPVACKLIGSVDEGGIGYVQLFDYTNNNIICELTINSSSVGIFETSIVQNIPTEESIFEIRAMSSSNSKKIQLYNLVIQF